MLYGDNINLNKQGQLQNAIIHPLAAAPAAPVLGQLYYDTVLLAQGLWNGTVWTYDAPRLNPLSVAGVPTANFGMGGFKFINNAIGVAGNDLPTMAQLQAAIDQIVLGLSWKQQIRSVFTANTALTGVVSNDGVTFNNLDRVLLTAQTTTTQNGSYIWQTGGTLVRAGDAANNFELQEGATFEVTEGTLGNPGGVAPQRWYITTIGAIVPGTTAVSIIVIGSGGGTYSAGANVTIVSNVIAVPNGTFTKKYAIAIGTGAATSIVITHNFGLIAVAGVFPITSQVFDLSGNLIVCDIQSTTANTTTYTFNVAPTTGQFVAVAIA